MKKAILFVFLTTMMTANAQLKVNSNGNVFIKDSLQDNHAILSIGTDPEVLPGENSTKTTGLYVHSRKSGNTNYCEGIFGEAVGTGTNIGVWGVGRGSQNENIGIAGLIQSSASGAGVFGSYEGGIPPYVDFTDGYAGYFYGDVYIDGYAIALDYQYISDMRLKKNVLYLCDEVQKGERSTLNNLLGLNVIEYDLNLPHQKEEKAWLQKNGSKRQRPTDIRHFGLSAQELQKIYPNLVHEGSDGYLSVNYIELVPLLIRSIQELKQELEEIKCLNKNVKKVPMKDDVEATNVAEVMGETARNILYQNSPNPFSLQTTIRFSLTPDATNAYIYIFDMTGKIQKQIPVNSSMQSITINGYELSAGMYIYSLMVNGKEIDTKRMILSK